MTVMAPLLSPQQLDTYQREGVLVVENVLNKAELEAARSGLTATLQKHGVDPHHLATTGHHLAGLSSTGGSGGVLDVFYEDWQIAVATNEKFFRITTELWRAAYSYRKEDAAADAQNDGHQGDPQQSCWQWHPYGPFDCDKGYLYLDRIGYRIPTALAEQLGTTQPNKKGENKKTIPIQRSLTPHLDCCPDKFFDEDNPKWRPIQSFISLSDTLEANQGGFEVARGFHRDFAHWAAHRPPTVVVKRKKARPKHQPHETSYQETTEFPAPCVGNYTHIRPKEDAAVLQRVRHVPVPAGGAVFWDNRLPHANAYRHLGATPRAVVYGSFLPDVPVNRTYAARQLENWKRGRNPTDQWIVVPDNNDDKIPGCSSSNIEGEESSLLLDQQRRMDNVLSTPLARKLAGLEPW